MSSLCLGSIEIKSESAANPRGRVQASTARRHFQGPENPGRPTACLQGTGGPSRQSPALVSSPKSTQRLHKDPRQALLGNSITHAESFCAGQPRKGRKALIIRFHGQSDLLTGGATWLLCATAVCTHWGVCLYTLGYVCVGGVHPACTSTPTPCDPGPLSSWVQATGK